jgi:hypothetical protein
MKIRIPAVLATLAVLAVAFGAVASAASTKTSKGTLHAFSYDKDKKAGRLTLVIKGDKTRFRVPSSTNCGVSYGQSGDQIPCRTLGKDKYHGRTVTVNWTKADDGGRVASLVSVRMY